MIMEEKLNRNGQRKRKRKKDDDTDTKKINKKKINRNER